MSVAGQIAAAIGLDEETVATQILPSLDAYKSRDAVKAHLKTLLGDGPQATSAIQAYISSQPRLALPLMPDIPSSQSPAPTKKKPQTVKSALKPVAARPVTDWSSQFGTQGSVLQKNRDDDLLWDIGGSSTSATHSRPSSGRSTPLPLGGAIQIKQAPARKSGGAGGLTSDLLGGGGRKVSQEGNKKEPPKSAEVVRIETLIADVESSGEDGTELRKRALKKAKGGCFCLGRLHSLSKHTPQCPSCSLTLCNLQLPYLPCPSCSSTLLNHSTKARLLLVLQTELADQHAKEERERARLREEAREAAWRESGGGSFPTLSGGPPVRPAQPEVRKVMSLNKKTGKIEMKSYVKKESPAPTRPSSPERETVVRIPSPRTTYATKDEREEALRKVLAERNGQGRTFLDIDGLSLVYQAKKVVQSETEGAAGGEKKKRRRGRGKKGKDGDGETEGTESIAGDDSSSAFANEGRSDGGDKMSKGKEVSREMSKLSLQDPPLAPLGPKISSQPPPSTSSSSKYSVSHPPPIRLLTPGTKVLVIQKQDQPTGKTTAGEVMEVLTRGDHPRGVKVRCRGGMVGRVVGLQ